MGTFQKTEKMVAVDRGNYMGLVGKDSFDYEAENKGSSNEGQDIPWELHKEPLFDPAELQPWVAVGN